MNDAARNWCFHYRSKLLHTLCIIILDYLCWPNEQNNQYYKKNNQRNGDLQFKCWHYYLLHHARVFLSIVCSLRKVKCVKNTYLFEYLRLLKN